MKTTIMFAILLFTSSWVLALDGKIYTGASCTHSTDGNFANFQNFSYDNKVRYTAL